MVNFLPSAWFQYDGKIEHIFKPQIYFQILYKNLTNFWLILLGEYSLESILVNMNVEHTKI